jgi:hypothetical protein
MFYSFKNDNTLGFLVGRNCVGDCSGADVTVRVQGPNPEGLPTMSAVPGSLLVYNPYVPQVDFDLWHMTPQQQSDVQTCMATGGEYDSSDLKNAASAKAAAQVRDPNGKPAKYTNNKPIIPNIKGAKRAPSAGAITGAVGFLGGALGCVNNLANK